MAGFSGTHFLFRCLLPVLLKLTLLPLLVAVAAPISALLRVVRFFLSTFDPLLSATSAPHRFCVVVFNAASSFEAEALVRDYARSGVAVVAVDRNVAVLSELFKHEARHVHCVGLSSSSSDAARDQLRDTIAKTGRDFLFGVFVVEPSGECVMRRLMEREAILGNNLRSEFVQSHLLAALCDFVTVRAETGSDHIMMDGEHADHHHHHHELGNDTAIEVCASQQCKLVSVALNSALVPIMLRDSKMRKNASSSSFFFSSSDRLYKPRVVYVSRSETVEMGTALAYVLAAQQHLPTSSTVTALPSVAQISQAAVRAACRGAAEATGHHVAFSEVVLFATSKQLAAREKFELRMANFASAASNISQAENRIEWRTPSVIHGRNSEILATSFSASPARSSSPTSGSSSNDNKSSSSVSEYAPLIVALGNATGAATPQPLSFCCGLQPEDPPMQKNKAGAAGDASFVAPSWWSIGIIAAWLREETLIRDLISGSGGGSF